MAESKLEFCKSIPKVELHAHLNGSISTNTMKLLIERRSKKMHQENHSLPQMQDVLIDNNKLDSAFKAFQVIHSIVDDEEAISLAACEVVRDFYEDNVKYLELRTTPRANPKTGMTKQSYIEAVKAGIDKCMEALPPNGIVVRLLLSVDRRQDKSEAHHTLSIAHQYSLTDDVMRQGRVVGLDLSGHPKAGSTADIVELLNEAKKLGMKLSVHMSERPDSEADSRGLLSIGVDRIGHGTYLHRGTDGHMSSLVQNVLDRRIPIEICMTSNVKAQTVECYEKHHFKFWRERKHPVIICTDDKGVFSTTLSKEYCIGAETFGISNDELVTLSKESVDHIFEDSHVKEMLKQHFIQKNCI